MDSTPRPRSARRRRVSAIRRWVAIAGVSTFFAAAGLVSQPSTSSSSTTTTTSSVTASSVDSGSDTTSNAVAPMTTRQS